MEGDKPLTSEGRRPSRRFLSVEAPSEVARPSRELRLGVDYGTSMSKLVITDYGAPDGERSFVVRPTGSSRDDYRIPSSVCIDPPSVRFGAEAEALGKGTPVYRSLKMRCAYPERFFGDHVPLPGGLDARALATLYIGHLIDVGSAVGRRYAARLNVEPSMSVTLGAPMAQLDDDGLSRMFLGMAREAFGLAQRLDLREACPINHAKEALAAVRRELAGNSAGQPRDWVRSEAEAALFWAHRSPEIGSGRYACIDVGAGTTSASWFHISAASVGKTVVNDRLSFYGAACSPPACDAVGRVLADCVEGASTLRDVRGREEEIINDLSTKGRARLDGVLMEIAKVFGEASRLAYEKEKSTRAWRDVGRVFLLGGGTKLSDVRRRLIAQKSGWLQAEPIANPRVPPKLMEEDGTEFRGDPAFLLVAYGLAHRLGDVPPAFSPRQVEDFRPQPPVRQGISHADIYSS